MSRRGHASAPPIEGADLGPLQRTLDGLAAAQDKLRDSAARVIDAEIARRVAGLRARFPRHRFTVVNGMGTMFTTVEARTAEPRYAKRHAAPDMPADHFNAMRDFLGEGSFRHREQMKPTMCGDLTDRFPVMEAFWTEIEAISELMIQADDDFERCVDGTGGY